MGKNVIIFGSDISGSRLDSNKSENVLVLGRDFAQKLNDKTIYAEKMYSPNFTAANKNFV